MTINLKPVAVPAATTRERGPNEYAPVFAALKEADGALAAVIPTADVKRFVRLVRLASEGSDKTVRTRYAEVKTPKDHTEVTMWLVPRITRPRKPAAQSAE